MALLCLAACSNPSAIEPPRGVGGRSDPGSLHEPIDADAPRLADDAGTTESAFESGLLETLSSLPRDSWPAQRTVRLSYDDGSGDVTLYIVWRMERPDRFSLLAKDRLGRTWWTLSVDGDRATTVEQRRGTYCSYDRVVHLDALPLGPLEFEALPLLLSGMLPTTPSSQLSSDGEGEWRIRGHRGREWLLRAAIEGEAPQVEAWSLLEDGEPIAWFERRDDLLRLSSRTRSGGLQLRWKLGSAQSLSAPALDLQPPPGTTPGLCD